MLHSMVKKSIVKEDEDSNACDEEEKNSDDKESEDETIESTFQIRTRFTAVQNLSDGSIETA